MSEESGTGAPAGAESEDGVKSTPRRPHWVSALRRTRLRVRIAAAVVIPAVAAAVIAALVVGAAPSSPQRLEYTRLPAPCTMVTTPTLTRYLPYAESGTLTASSSSKDIGAGGCAWYSYTLGGSRLLLLHVDLLDAPRAQLSGSQDAPDAAPLTYCPSCQGATMVRRNVSGLGDQAIASFITVKTPSAPAGVPWKVPQIGLAVRSGNAIITVTYVVYAGLNSPPRPATSALLADAIAIARDVLAALAGRTPVSTAAPPAYTSRRGLLYAAPRDPCPLVKASTLVRYAPGVTLPGISSPPGTYSFARQEESCLWSAGSLYYVSVFLTVYANPADAETQVLNDVQSSHNGVTGTLTGERQVSGLGDQATAIFITDTGDDPEVDLYIWEANAAIETTFVLTPPGAPLSNSEMLTADTAISRDVLAGLPRS